MWNGEGERKNSKFELRQGSVLGPTLWLIYIQSLLDRLDGECEHFAYADDIAIILKISTPEEIAKLKEILQILLDWGKEYGMKWGAHKTQRMAFRYHKRGPTTTGNTFRRQHYQAHKNNRILGSPPK